MFQNQYDITIIGAGFAGAATAYFLAKKTKVKILILEREPRPGLHASGKNAGLFRQAVANPQIAKFIQTTRRFLQDPPSDWSHRGLFEMTGSYLLGREDRLRRLQAVLASHKALAKLYTSNDLPLITPSPLGGEGWGEGAGLVLHCPEDGIVDPKALLENLLWVAQENGAELRLNSSVNAYRQEENHWIVETNHETTSTKVLINAAGAWAQTLAEGAGIKTEKLTPYRRHLYKVKVASPCLNSDENSLPKKQAQSLNFPYVWNLDAECYFRPHQEGLLLCPGDETEHPPSNPQVDPQIELLLRKKIQKNFPKLSKFQINEAWACLRTKTQDGNFKLGWDQKANNYFWVAGLGGHGLSASLGVGQWAARSITRTEKDKIFDAIQANL